jgi:uncharacterized protein (TIGR03086 family)
MIDLEPATRALTVVVKGVRDDQLSAPTPCGASRVADLLDHVDGLSQAFRAAAMKTPIETNGRSAADGSRLGTDWRTRIPERLDALADAWRGADAWTGMTRAGGVDLPGEVAALVAIDEVIVHGWDIAVATGQPYSCEPALIEAALTFVRAEVGRNPNGTAGLFGPPVPVPHDASSLERLIGLTGRNPAWVTTAATA